MLDFEQTQNKGQMHLCQTTCPITRFGTLSIVLPLIFYILLLTSIWGKFTGKIRKRLLLGSLLTGVLSYIALGAHYGALVNSLGMSLLIGAFVYWLRREG